MPDTAAVKDASTQKNTQPTPKNQDFGAKMSRIIADRIFIATKSNVLD